MDKKKELKTEQLTFRCTPTIRNFLEKKAEEENRTVANVLENLVLNEMKKDKKSKGEKR